MGEETAASPQAAGRDGRPPDHLAHPEAVPALRHLDDFIICAGYAGEMLADHFAREGDETGRVQVVDTGLHTATGGRLSASATCSGDDTFCMTYGDGVADVNLKTLLEFHRTHRKLVTVTAVQPVLPFGVITFKTLAGGTVEFEEKPRLHAVWVNSGFFVIEPRALDVIEGDDDGLGERAADPAWRGTDSWRPSATRASGTAWTRRRIARPSSDLWGTDRASWKLW